MIIKIRSDYEPMRSGWLEVESGMYIISSELYNSARQELTDADWFIQNDDELLLYVYCLTVL